MQDRQVRQAIEGRYGYPIQPRSLAQSRAGRRRRDPCDGTSSRVTIGASVNTFADIRFGYSVQAGRKTRRAATSDLDHG